MPLKEKLSAVRRTAKEKSPASLASMTVNFFSALIKIVAGALGSSFYVIVNGLYSFAVGGAKATYFFSKKRASLHEEKRRKYLLLCGILTAATLLSWFTWDTARRTTQRHSIKKQKVTKNRSF